MDIERQLNSIALSFNPCQVNKLQLLFIIEEACDEVRSWKMIDEEAGIEGLHTMYMKPKFFGSWKGL